jgi:hypothetical protein
LPSSVLGAMITAPVKLGFMRAEPTW